MVTPCFLSLATSLVLIPATSRVCIISRCPAQRPIRSLQLGTDSWPSQVPIPRFIVAGHARAPTFSPRIPRPPTPLDYPPFSYLFSFATFLNSSVPSYPYLLTDIVSAVTDFTRDIPCSCRSISIVSGSHLSHHSRAAFHTYPFPSCHHFTTRFPLIVSLLLISCPSLFAFNIISALGAFIVF